MDRMAHDEAEYEKREANNRVKEFAPMAWIMFANGLLAAGCKITTATGTADAMLDAWKERFGGTD